MHLPNPFLPSTAEPRNYSIPSWVLSVILHITILAALLINLQNRPAGQDETPGHRVGIILKETPQQGEIYQGQTSEQPEETTPPLPSPSKALLNQVPVDFASQLPEPDSQILGPGPEQSLPQSSRTPVRSRPFNPPAATRSGVPFFGIEDPAQKITYVVDRSSSMSDRRRLAEAKVELLSSLETLQEHQQFQIIFYNRDISILSVDQTGRMPFAVEVNKTLATRFVQGIEPRGSTDHHKALIQALQLGTEALFLLTDADAPRLQPSDLDDVTRHNNRRTRIHAIEFGVGPSLGNDNFLKQLARRNQGSYRYVNVSEFIR